MQRLNHACQMFEDWENFLKNFFEKSHRIEYYFIYYLFGNRLNKLNKQNFGHYLKFISQNVDPSRLDLKKPKSFSSTLLFRNSQKKVKFLQEIIKKNQKIFMNPSQALTERGGISNANINLIRVPSEFNHQTLVYVYKQKLNAELVPSLLLFCNRNTTWPQIDCNLFNSY